MKTLMTSNKNAVKMPIPEYKTSDLWPHSKRLSSTQVLDYMKSPSGFYDKWMLLQRHESQAMIIGRIFSAMYADRKTDFTPDLVEAGASSALIARFKKALICLPKPDKAEYSSECEINGWTIAARLDGIKGAKIIENKTGKVAWTQSRVESSAQQTLQSWARWKETGRVPSLTLNWIDTDTAHGEFLHTFKTKRAVDQLRDFEQRIVEAINGIKEERF